MSAYPFGITVTFQRPTFDTDRYDNDTITGWEDRVTVTGVAWAPMPSMTLTDQGRTGNVLEGPSLFGVPVDAGVKRRDRCTIDNQLFEVEGEPMYWRHPMSGSDYGTVTTLRRVEG